MTDTSANNKRIAKNTVALYIRTFITMIVSLFTSRMVLNILGIEDYGIYNLVGGVVIIFSLISSSLTVSISRNLTYELGHGDEEKLKKTFSTSLNIQIILSLVIVILVETIGLWFLLNYAKIPTERISASIWVLQFSLITFVLNLISVPYNASIISHEKMGVYAYIGILEALLKLAVVYCLYLTHSDKLIIYSGLLAAVSLIIRSVYNLYCKNKFQECVYRKTFDKRLIKEMFSFAGWSFLGTSVNALNTHGLNILCNVFFGVVVNASRGVASQASGAVWGFVNNFTMAYNPQIIKSYATKDYQTCFNTVCQGAKYSCFLMLLIFIPLELEANYVFTLWLKDVPHNAVFFFQLSMLCIFIDIPGRTLETLAKATGNIKEFYIKISLMAGLTFPLTYLFFKCGFDAYYADIVYAGIYALLLFVRLRLVSNETGLSSRLFITQVVLRVLIVGIVSFVLPLSVRICLPEGLFRLLLVCMTGVVALSFSVLYLGMKKQERIVIYAFMNKKINSYKHKKSIKKI